MIRPVSFASNNVKFGHIIEGDSKSKSEQFDKYMSTSDREKLALKNGVIAGMFLGSVLAMASTSMYKDNQIDNLLKDLAAESTYAPVDTFKIEDVNKDKIPEFVLIDELGNRTAYDFTSGKIYLDEDGELIEKIK